MAKAQKNAASVAKKWVQNTGAASQAYTDGVNAVQVAPGQLAAAAAPKMLAKVTAAINSGKYASRVSGVSLGSWKSSATTKGAQRLGPGATAAEPKMTAFLNEFLPIAAQVSAQVDSMPKMTIEDSVARSAAAIRAFAQWGASRK